MVFCTYCSRAKSPAPGLVPAIRRYRSDRIDKVLFLARMRGCEFYILSGKFGLLLHSDPVPYYDHLLQENEVAPLAKVVAGQLRERFLSAVRYFSNGVEDHPALRPYLALMRLGCQLAAVRLELVNIQESETMTDHMDTFASARRCRDRMVQNREDGESCFRDLLEHHPSDGILYLRRAEAYEALAEWALAQSDYQKAEVFLWRDDYKQQARGGSLRVREKQSVGASAAASTTSQPVANVDRRQLEDMFQVLLDVLRQVDPTTPEREQLSARIERLKKAKVVPSGIASHMHTIREYRNLAVKEQQTFSGIESAAILAAWSAVEAWAKPEGHLS